MHSVRQCSKLFLPRHDRVFGLAHSRLRSSAATPSGVEVDEHGIPLRATWSVNDLLSSYPKPTISATTLKRLYELSALVPPQEGTPQHAQITSEMEDLVKLVEAVKMVDVGQDQGAGVHGIPDGRIWAEGDGICLTAGNEATENEEAHGRALLKHAQRTENGLYVVPKHSRRAK